MTSGAHDEWMDGSRLAARVSATLGLCLRWFALVGLYAAAAAKASEACSGSWSRSLAPKEDEIVISTLVQARAEDVWQVLTDFEGWVHFLPDLESIRVTRSEGGRLVVEQTNVTLGRRIRTTSSVAFDAERGELRLELDPSIPQDLEDMTSIWTVSRCPNGSARVELRLRLRSGHPVPRFFERRAAASAVRSHVEALADVVERRAHARLATR